MYFTLINDLKYDSEFHINDPVGLPASFDLMSGKAMPTDIRTPLVYTTNAQKGDELRAFFRGSFTIMSAELLKLFKESGVDNLQTFPAIIRSTEDGNIWDNYFGVNVLGLISCADLSKSSYSETMHGHYRFKTLAIDSTKTDGALMFRLQEHTPTIIIHRSVGRYIKDKDPDKILKGWSVGNIIQ